MNEREAPPALVFSEGLIGCPDWQRFSLDRSPALAPLSLLVSTDQPGVSLPAVSPWLVKHDYSPQLADADRAALGSADDGDLEWLAILNIQAEPLIVTANLLGPVVFNRRTGEARQVVLSQSGYSAAHSVGAASAQDENEVTYARADATA